MKGLKSDVMSVGTLCHARLACRAVSFGIRPHTIDGATRVEAPFGLPRPAPRHTSSESHMSLYQAYLDEIETRKAEGLSPKPIDDAALLSEVIEHRI